MRAELELPEKLHATLSRRNVLADSQAKLEQFYSTEKTKYGLGLVTSNTRIFCFSLISFACNIVSTRLLV
jgi:hypothetical protein